MAAGVCSISFTMKAVIEVDCIVRKPNEYRLTEFGRRQRIECGR